MPLDVARHPLVVVVGSGGVGKTTLAAALGIESAKDGHDTLVMTFDPSLRLKDALGVGEAARDAEAHVPLAAPARIDASLLDGKRTFDRLVARYAPDEGAARRILENRYYDRLAGTLSGVLEYMAVERLFEVTQEGGYERVVLDTPPTRQALDFLEAPDRIVAFLESEGVRVATREWFDAKGRLRATKKLGAVGRGIEAWLDRIVGLDFLREMAEFFQAFGPLYAGFRERAHEVRRLLRDPGTLFVLVAGPAEEAVPDTLFFARRLVEAGHHLGPVVVNRVHPSPKGPADAEEPDGLALLRWLGERDARGVATLRRLLAGRPLVEVPLLAAEPSGLDELEALGRRLRERLAAV
jgi:anion-transporting  ArsA/GET3 family ATPase